MILCVFDSIGVMIQLRLETTYEAQRGDAVFIGTRHSFEFLETQFLYPQVSPPDLSPRHEVKAAAHETGRRLRIARENARMTQAATAREVNIDRTTVADIEQGGRPPTAGELLRFCEAFGISANKILCEESVFAGLAARFRTEYSELEAAEREAVDTLNYLVEAEIEFERVLGVKRAFNCPPERPLQPGPARKQAEADAVELRQWLGLGNEPILDVVSMMEERLGIRVYRHAINPCIAGLFVWDESMGACVLLCSSHQREQIQLTAAHALGHFLTARSTPLIVYRDRKPQSRIEKYANQFAKALLMPRLGLERRFADVARGNSNLTRRQVLRLSRSFGVFREVLVRRLKDLKLARTRTWEQLMNTGSAAVRQTEQIAGPPTRLDAATNSPPIRPRVTLLVQEAWRRELYSEGQLSRMLRLHRRDLRKIIYEAQISGSEVVPYR